MPVNYQAGLYSVGSYQASGKPWASGSIDASAASPASTKIAFPTVTRWVQITNHDGNNLGVGFSHNGLIFTSNYFNVPGSSSSGAGQSGRLELKVKELYFNGSSNFDIVAGLTGINATQLPTNWSASSGVG